MICELNRDILKDTIIASVMKELINTGQFESTGTNTVKTIGNNFQTVIDDINTKYGENILNNLEINPSEALIDKYLGMNTANPLPTNPQLNQNEEATPGNKVPEPSIYSTIYDYANDDLLKQKIDEIFEELPNITRRITSNIKDEEEKNALLKYLSTVAASKNEKDKLIAQFQMIFNTTGFLLELDKQSIEASKETDPNIRLLNLYSIKKTVDSYENFSELLGELSNLFSEQVGRPENLKKFYNQLNAGIATPKSVSKRLEESRASALQTIITDYNDPIASKQIKEINDRIKEFQDKLAATSNIKQIALYTKKINELKKDKQEKIASPEAIDAIFKGNFRDANSISMYLEALIANGHPVVSTVASILADIDIEINQDMLNSVNEMQRANDELSRDAKVGLRDVEKRFSPILDKVKRASRIKETVLDDGTTEYKPVYSEQKMFLSPYSSEYIQKFEELDVFEEFYKFKIREAKKATFPDPAQVQMFEDKLEEVLQERRAFKRENSEGKYMPEVYDMWALLEKPISLPDGTTTSVSKMKGDLTTSLKINQELLETTEDPELRDIISDTLDDTIRSIKELRNPYDSSGQLKTGADKEISDNLLEFYRQQKLYGDFIITDKQRGLFEADLQILKRKLQLKEISPEEYTRQHSLMTRDEIDPKFFDLQKEYSDLLAEYSKQLAAIPGFGERLNIKDQLKDNFDKLRFVTNPFRDEDGKIDGIDFESQRQDVKIQVKEIQVAYEKLKSETMKLKGLSLTDSLRLNELYSIRRTQDFTEMDRQEMLDLQEKDKIAREEYKDNKELIDNYLAAFRELGALTESQPSHYYYEQKDNITNSLKSSAEVQAKVDETLAIGKFTIKEKNDSSLYVNNNYELVGDTWYRNKQLISDTGSEEEVRALLSKYFAEKALTNSDWFIENHFDSYEWNEGTKRYEKVQKPIYIWVEQKPRDPKWVLKDQPSFRYKKFEIKQEFYNPNYSYISKYIPSPKPGKFVNPAYETLKNSAKTEDKAYYKFLKFSVNKYNKDQDSLPQKERLGPIFPSIIKSTGENSVEFTNNMKENFTQLFKQNITAGEDNDTAYLLGGSIKSNPVKQVPIRFTKRIDGDNQTSNVAGALLMFELATKKYEKLQEKEYFFKSLQETLKILEVKDSQLKGMKFSLRNIGKVLKGKTETELVDKTTENSVLYRTVTNALNMFVYGEMSQESYLNTPLGKIDLNKASSGLMNFASKATFIGAVASPIKNTISTGVQTIINSNTQQGFYSASDFRKAQGQSFSYMKDFYDDFQKAGDRSFIGQMFQYFSVLPESLYDEYGKKTQFTYAKEKFTLLSGIKNFSEFEATIKQFLAVANATKIKIGDKDVSLLEAYELGPDKNLRLKPGAQFTKDQENRFIKLVHHVNRNISGAYREDEKNYAETFTLGKLGMFMNRYYPSLAANRWSGTRYSIETGQISRGFYRDGFDFFKEGLIDYQFNLKAKWADMSPRERANALKFIKEISFIAMLSLLIFLMGGDDSKKELRKNTAFYNFAIGTLIGVNNETQTFIDYHDLVRKMQSPFMAVNQIKQTVKVFDLLISAGANASGLVDIETTYKRSTGIDDGLHDKGDSKLLANFLKLVGYSGKTFYPVELISTQKSFSQLR